MPTIVVPMRNWTCATVAPAPGAAVAVRVTLLPAVTTAPVNGAVSEIVGTAAATTLTLTVDEVTAVPLESVTRAVSVVIPAAVGVQEKLYVEPVVGAKAVPTTVVPERKSTRVTVVPLLAAAVALNVAAVPSVSDAPLVGAVRETVGTPAATVTLTAEEVMVAPLESVTRAVSAAAPVAVGVQLIV